LKIEGDLDAGMRGFDTEPTRGKSFVRTKKSILDEVSLSQAIRAAYDLSSTIDVRLYRISGSDVYRVTGDAGEWFLKIYRSTAFDARRARSSARAMDLLSRHGLSVPRPVSTRGGSSLVELQCAEGPRLGYMYPAVSGWEPVEDDAAEARRYGETAAQMHTVMDEIAPAGAPACAGDDGPFKVIDYDYLFGRYLRGVERLIGHETSAIRFLRRLARALWRQLDQRLPASSPQFGFCHGDMHTGNAVLTDSDQLYLLDFDACGFGWRVMDIGTYVVTYDWMGLDEAAQAKRRQITSDFLAGYTTIRPVTEEEVRTLDLFMAIRHFELFGIGVYRAPFVGDHWINSRQLHAAVAWFQTWLSTCDWFRKELG
jgi:Ser/Thr protein kinase RdoA (MazF antagonist)